jgi:hypothetical protein
MAFPLVSSAPQADAYIFAQWTTSFDCACSVLVQTAEAELNSAGRMTARKQRRARPGLVLALVAVARGTLPVPIADDSKVATDARSE